MKSLTVYFDYISPFAYLAAELLPALAARAGLALKWTPIEMEKLSNFADGLPYSTSKRRYVVVDAARSAEFHGTPIRIPKPHPVASAGALRLATAALADARFPQLHRALFRAAWRDQRDLSSREVLVDCIEAADGPAEDWLRRAETTEVSLQLAEATGVAEADGVFGVPSMQLDGELFWGLDSLPVLEWRLSRTS